MHRGFDSGAPTPIRNQRQPDWSHAQNLPRTPFSCSILPLGLSSALKRQCMHLAMPTTPTFSLLVRLLLARCSYHMCLGGLGEGRRFDYIYLGESPIEQESMGERISRGDLLRAQIRKKLDEEDIYTLKYTTM